MEHKTAFAPIHIILASLIGIVLLLNAYQLFNLGPAEPKLPEIKVTLLTADCADCFDLKTVYDGVLAGKTYKVTDNSELAITDSHAQKLITDNNITRLPALVIEGDTSGISLSGARKLDDVLIIDSPAPYYDIQSGAVNGRVSLMYVTADACKECINITVLGSQLAQTGVAVASEKTFTSSSDDGKRIINAYSITKLPAVIMSPDIKAYDTITTALAEEGDFAPDGSFVLRKLNPPYYDLTTNTVRGRVDVTYLVDATCTTCYNVTMHKSILTGFGILLASEKTIDVSSDEGKALISANQIEMVPTIILTGEPQLYSALQQVWPQVGTAENNAYVFRHTELLSGAVSKNLTNNKTLVGAQ